MIKMHSKVLYERRPIDAAGPSTSATTSSSNEEFPAEGDEYNKMFDNYGRSQEQSPTTPPAPQKVMRFDKGYVTTVPGMLKVVQILASLIGFIAIKFSWSAWISAVFYNILYWVCILVSGFILLSYTFHFVEKFDRWPWMKLEFFFCSFVCVAYIILSIIATALAESTGYVVGFFGLCALIAYGYDGFLKYKGWKRGLPPQ